MFLWVLQHVLHRWPRAIVWTGPYASHMTYKLINIDIGKGLRNVVFLEIWNENENKLDEINAQG